MTIKKTTNGQYKLDIRPDGVKGKRIIKTFKYKVDAVQYERKILSGRLENQDRMVSLDNRTLTELIQLWYDLHGISLKSSIDTKNRLLKLSEQLNNPVACEMTSEQIAKYRRSRLDLGIVESTLNRELNTLKAMFRELKRMSVIDYESDILPMRKLRETKIELTYLTIEQIEHLIEQVKNTRNISLLPVFLICLATGARWSEVETLSKKNIVNNGIMFEDTKNGRSRYVPVSDEILELTKNAIPFQSCYGAFRSAFGRCGFNVTVGQLAHILRHTFASHFIMNGGNIRTLQTILGHSTLQMTMRYTHLAPDYMNQAKELNPLESGKIMERIIEVKKKPVDKNI